MKIITACLAWLFCVSTLFAGAAPYIGFALGGVSAEDSDYSYKGALQNHKGKLRAGEGGAIEGAFGIDFDAAPFRVEGALTLLISEIESIQPDGLGGITLPLDDSGVGVASFMFNGYFDIPTGAFAEPYLFAGMGRATVFHELNNKQVEDEVGAFQLGAGIGFKLTDYFLLDLKYQYFATGGYEVSNGGEKFSSDFASHQFLAGFRVRL
jgi:opacity protein-like surface antigen